MSARQIEAANRLEQVNLLRASRATDMAAKNGTVIEMADGNTITFYAN